MIFVLLRDRSHRAAVVTASSSIGAVHRWLSYGGGGSHTCNGHTDLRADRCRTAVVGYWTEPARPSHRVQLLDFD